MLKSVNYFFIPENLVILPLLRGENITARDPFPERLMTKSIFHIPRLAQSSWKCPRFPSIV